MSQSSPTTCASCGAAGTGRFCSACGAPRGGAACAGCGSPLAAGIRFCPACGRAAAAGEAPRSADRTPWIVAGAALAGLLAVLLLMLVRSAPQSPAAAPAGDADFGPMNAGSPPDISGMSPRERFDRLYNRVMQAAQSGDEATVTRFTPMALMAYDQLDTVDAEARYHAALLQGQTGDVAGPAAQADTILKQVPGHLFGYIIQGTVARWQKNEKALDRAYAGFLSHYDAELKAGRVEYEEHKMSLDEFRKAALEARGQASAGT